MRHKTAVETVKGIGVTSDSVTEKLMKTRTRTATNTKQKAVSFENTTIVIGVVDETVDRGDTWELPRTCDACSLYILGTRFECAKCLEEEDGEEFDLCKFCFERFRDDELQKNKKNKNKKKKRKRGGCLHGHDIFAFRAVDVENEGSVEDEKAMKLSMKPTT